MDVCNPFIKLKFVLEIYTQIYKRPEIWCRLLIYVFVDKLVEEK